MNERIKATIGAYSDITGLRINLERGDKIAALALAQFGSEDEQRELAQQLIKAINTGVQFETSEPENIIDQEIKQVLGRSPEEQAAHERTCPVCAFNRAIRTFIQHHKEQTGKEPEVDLWINALFNIIVAYAHQNDVKDKSSSDLETSGWLLMSLATTIAEHLQRAHAHEILNRAFSKLDKAQQQH